VQPLQLAFRHRVEVDPANPFLGVWSLQPTKENLGSTRICDRLLAQATFDLCVGRRLWVGLRVRAWRTRGDRPGLTRSLAARRPLTLAVVPTPAVGKGRGL
jgi:hypothetical protein